jgi:carboxylesterase
MKGQNHTNKVKIHPMARSVYLKGGKTAVLLIHGYLGSPRDIIYLAERLNSEGYTISVPRLPGHGTNRKDFLNSEKNDWIREIRDNYIKLNRICKDVYIAGFSMGGLLAIIIAAEFNPDKLILIAPALTNRRKLMLYSTPILRLFIKSLNKKCEIKTNSEYEEYLKNEYWSKDWIKAASEILFLQIKAKCLLKSLKSEILILLSENDRTVPLSVSRIAEKKIDKDKLTEKRIRNSGHMIFHGEYKEKGADIIINWLKSN